MQGVITWAMAIKVKFPTNPTKVLLRLFVYANGVIWQVAFFTVTLAVNLFISFCIFCCRRDGAKLGWLYGKQEDLSAAYIQKWFVSFVLESFCHEKHEEGNLSDGKVATTSTSCFGVTPTTSKFPERLWRKKREIRNLQMLFAARACISTDIHNCFWKRGERGCRVTQELFVAPPFHAQVCVIRKAF